jgi:hypothetical protein
MRNSNDLLVHLDPDRLYDETITTKMSFNAIGEENVKLKTKVATLRKEIS